MGTGPIITMIMIGMTEVDIGIGAITIGINVLMNGKRPGFYRSAE
jgi:hypothetical protein